MPFQSRCSSHVLHKQWDIQESGKFARHVPARVRDKLLELSGLNPKEVIRKKQGNIKFCEGCTTKLMNDFPNVVEEIQEKKKEKEEKRKASESNRKATIVKNCKGPQRFANWKHFPPGPFSIDYEDDKLRRNRTKKARLKTVISKAYELTSKCGGNILIRYCDEHQNTWTYCNNNCLWEQYTTDGVKPGKEVNTRYNEEGKVISVVNNSFLPQSTPSKEVVNNSLPQPTPSKAVVNNSLSQPTPSKEVVNNSLPQPTPSKAFVNNSFPPQRTPSKAVVNNSLPQPTPSKAVVNNSLPQPTPSKASYYVVTKSSYGHINLQEIRSKPSTSSKLQTSTSDV